MLSVATNVISYTLPFPFPFLSARILAESVPIQAGSASGALFFPPAVVGSSLVMAVIAMVNSSSGSVIPRMVISANLLLAGHRQSDLYTPPECQERRPAMIFLRGCLFQFRYNKIPFTVHREPGGICSRFKLINGCHVACWCYLNQPVIPVPNDEIITITINLNCSWT